MPRRSILPAVSGLTLLFCVAAQAQDPVDPTALLSSADANHDGVISREEFLAARAGQFARIDHDHDGYVSETDADAMAQRAGRTFKRALHKADANGDGRISRDEYNALPTRGFDLLDANDDGMLDSKEAARATRQRAR